MNNIKLNIFNMKKYQKNISYFRFLVIADTHGTKQEELKEIGNLEYDICILLGDIFLNELYIIKSVVDKPIISIPGNHDTLDIYDRADIPCYNGKNTEINGIRFACAGGSTKYKESSYCMYTQEEMKEIFNHLESADILITHDRWFDKLQADNSAKCGFKAIGEYIKENKPVLHLYGHYHTPKIQKVEKTTCICCYGIQIVDANGKVKTILT